MTKRSPLVVLFLVVVIDLVGFGIVLPLLPRYARDYDASPTELGLLMASFSAVQFVFAPFWGRLSDRFGRRPILMAGLFGSVLAYTLFGLAGSIAVLLLSRVAAGFFGATIGTAQAYIADVTSVEERGRGMALIGAAFGLGFVIGPAIGGIASQWHHAAPGFIAAGLSAGAFAMAVFLLPEPPQHRERAASSFLDSGALRRALATRTVPLLLVLQFTATFAFAAFESTLSLLTKERFGYDERQNGYVFAFVGIVLLVAQGGLVRRMMPRVGELNLLVRGILLMIAGLLGVAAAPGLAILLASLAASVTGFAMVTPSLSSLLSRRTPREIQGEVLGVGQSMLSLARVLAPMAGNWLFAVAWGLPHVAAANLLLVAFSLALVLRRTPAADAAAAPPPL